MAVRCEDTASLSSFARHIAKRADTGAGPEYRRIPHVEFLQSTIAVFVARR